MNTQKIAEAEELLRRIAALPAPDGLEARLQARLAVALRQEPRRGLLSNWLESWQSLLLISAPMRAVAAVAIAAVVLGGGWAIARQDAVVGSAHNAQPAPMAAPAVSGFSTAGAIRVPQTVQGPVVNAQEPSVSPEKKQQRCAKDATGNVVSNCASSPAEKK